MNDLKSKTITSFAWDFGGKMAMFATAFVTTIILTRLLEPSYFGLIAIAIVFVDMALIISDAGLSSALIQRGRLHPVHYSSVFITNTAIGILLAAVTIFFAPSIAQFYELAELELVLQVLASLFVINALKSVQIARLRKQIRYALLTKCEYAATLASGVTGVVMAFMGYGIWSLVAQYMVRAILETILLWNVTGWTPSMRFSFKAVKSLLNFSIYIFLSSVVDNLANRLDTLIIGKIFSATTLGFYDRAKALNNIAVINASGSLISVLFPVLSIVKNDTARLLRIVLKLYSIVCFFIFFLIGGLFINSEEIVTILFTVKWIEVADYFGLIVIAGFSFPLSAILINVLMSRGKSKAFFKLEIYKKLLLFICLAVGLSWSIEAYLYGMIIVSCLSLWLNISFAAREIKSERFIFIKLMMPQVLVSILSAVAALSATATLELGVFTSLVVKSLLFGLLFLLLSWAFKTTPFQDLRFELENLIRKRFQTSP